MPSTYENKCLALSILGKSLSTLTYRDTIGFPLAGDRGSCKAIVDFRDFKLSGIIPLKEI